MNEVDATGLSSPKTVQVTRSLALPRLGLSRPALPALEPSPVRIPTA